MNGASNSKDFQIEDGILIKYLGTDRDVVIPDSVTIIGEKAFNKCKTIASIVIPNGVTGIGKYAFFECESLEKIELPRSLSHRCSQDP